MTVQGDGQKCSQPQDSCVRGGHRCGQHVWSRPPSAWTTPHRCDPEGTPGIFTASSRDGPAVLHFSVLHVLSIINCVTFIITRKVPTEFQAHQCPSNKGTLGHRSQVTNRTNTLKAAGGRRKKPEDKKRSPVTGTVLGF